MTPDTGWEKPEVPESPALPPPGSGTDCLSVILGPRKRAEGKPEPPQGQQEGAGEGAWEG